MASWKSKKGNPAERLIAYNLQLLDFNVIRPDDNSAGIDLIAKCDYGEYYIEVKFHKKFSWNQIKKIFEKTEKATPNGYIPLFIFKSNQQPWLVAYRKGISVLGLNRFQIVEMTDYFGCESIQPIPKGYKVWQNQKA